MAISALAILAFCPTIINMKMIQFVFKGIRKGWYLLLPKLSTVFGYLIFWINGAKFESVVCFGLPYVHVSLKGNLKVGHRLQLNSWFGICETSFKSRCRIEVLNGASLVIGDDVGLSCVAISCFSSIRIGDNVKIGAGSHVYDTDFHSLNYLERRDHHLDGKNLKSAAVVIEDDVFIGAHSIVLKGVTIGRCSIIGAGSVVTKSIPANEIWAGNPARFIRKI